MKHSIVAQNGTLEIPEHLDVVVWSAYLSAENTWTFVGGEFYQLKPGDMVLAAHFFGKNTAANPMIFLRTRLNEFMTSNYGDIVDLSDGMVRSFQGMADFNYLFRHEDLWDCLYNQFPVSVMELQIDTGSNFTGSLNADFYILKGSR